MNKQAHRNFAINSCGVSPAIYDSMNAKHEARNAAIRAARREYDVALVTGSPDLADKAAALDAILAA